MRLLKDILDANNLYRRFLLFGLTFDLLSVLIYTTIEINSSSPSLDQYITSIIMCILRLTIEVMIVVALLISVCRLLNKLFFVSSIA